MATTVIMPKLGNSVESTIIVAWKKAVGDTVAEDDILCEVETDKAVMEVPSTVSGTLLAILHEANDEVPVLANIAVIAAPKSSAFIAGTIAFSAVSRAANNATSSGASANFTSAP